MKVFALVCLGLALSVSALPSVREEEDAALAMINCVNKALDGGLPSADIPDHNPFVSPREFDYQLDVGLVSGNITVNNIVLSGITEFNVTTLEGARTPSGQGVAYNYALYWPDLWVDAQWAGEIHNILGGVSQNSGTIRIDLRDLVFSGVWNMTFPGQEGVEEHVDDFLVQTECSVAEFNFKGISSTVDALINGLVTPLLTGAVNIFFPSEDVSGFLKDRFNNIWIGNSSRIDAIIANCQ